MRAALILSLLATPSFADMTLTFVEGAPKDRFVVTNLGCALSDATLVIDLSTSPAGLIFDVTAQGAGVEVFQPVELIAGSAADGDQQLSITLGNVATGAEYIITADLDDLQSNGALGQIRVAGSEIAGASVAQRNRGNVHRSSDRTPCNFNLRRWLPHNLARRQRVNRHDRPLWCNARIRAFDLVRDCNHTAPHQISITPRNPILDLFGIR